MLNEFPMLKSMHFSWCQSTSESVQKDKNNCMTGTVGHLDSKVGTVWQNYPPHARMKFGKSWKGPYLVTRRLSNHVYEIQLTPRSPPLVVHVDHLKKHDGPMPVKIDWLLEMVCVSLLPQRAWGYPRGWGNWRWVCRGRRWGGFWVWCSTTVSRSSWGRAKLVSSWTPGCNYQSFPHEVSSSQDNHPDNPTNRNLTGYQGTQQPSNPNLMDDLNVRHSKRPRKPKIILDPSDQ